MKRARRTFILVFLTMPLVIAACGETKAPREFNDSALPADVSVGERFVIVLESNATTGYQWQLAQALDAAVVKQVSSEYAAPDTSRVGAGGKERWTFEATGKGKTKIGFKYVRPWEKTATPAKQETFEIVVR